MLSLAIFPKYIREFLCVGFNVYIHVDFRACLHTSYKNPRIYVGFYAWVSTCIYTLIFELAFTLAIFPKYIRRFLCVGFYVRESISLNSIRIQRGPSHWHENQRVYTRIYLARKTYALIYSRELKFWFSAIFMREYLYLKNWSHTILYNFTAALLTALIYAYIYVGFFLYIAVRSFPRQQYNHVITKISILFSVSCQYWVNLIT